MSQYHVGLGQLISGMIDEVMKPLPQSSGRFCRIFFVGQQFDSLPPSPGNISALAQVLKTHVFLHSSQIGRPVILAFLPMNVELDGLSSAQDRSFPDLRRKMPLLHCCATNYPMIVVAASDLL